MLKEEDVKPIPNISYKMPRKVISAQSIASKLPFLSSRIAQLEEIFHASNDSSTESMILDAPNERCVGSAQAILGNN
ncbi:hypothetical protein NC652_027070 [Populus alba x Populus x berolinensis]|uniref:BURP domain-containing protein n=1 Tax=Populus alba x Populus x berolinensis TaxID=444605 RepID=A0AAD6MBC9_9ROSI|nr:hypothetical protein NC652_025908 [Populus alba x Populus x berolinensis]KAJ6901158.1 hypothetical protein NC652_027059 [Populus alba x Populus x berolinensis]KAJ6901170.1 hypothetical protein NC652_027070 [Populus alba x Populus x berolinensis]KAJ6982369.1 hypothetical protein NC653_025471 [Populus alba x Populus x berolinensis]